jgi:hypothetical protein
MSTQKQEAESGTSYLTDAILTIHNEIQSALDYIENQATEEGTDLGKSAAMLSIQNLRVKIPVKIDIETKEIAVENDADNENETDPLARYRRKIECLSTKLRRETLLAQRAGLVFGLTESDSNTFITRKIKVVLAPIDTQQETDSDKETPKDMWGEIEITFSPVKRH